jgi:hypothetical protein
MLKSHLVPAQLFCSASCRHASPASAAGGATATAGWVYVAFRALYPVMAVHKGIGVAGAKAPILIATVPAYGALFAMASPVIRAVFF